MQDGIIKGVGNSRYLKSVPAFLSLYPTYEAFCEALIAGTLPIDLNGINEAGWTQTGTPLNKASLLKDTTAALYGLGNTAVPDDVLAKLQPMVKDGDAQVGDVLSTTRTDPGEEWFLCNGDFVKKSDYPAFGEASLSSFGDKGINDEEDTSLKLSAAAYHDGMWVAAGTTVNNDVSVPVIYYTTEPAGEWTRKLLSTAAYNLYDIIYADGKWVAVGYHLVNSNNVPVVFYATDPTGEWGIYDIIASQSIQGYTIAYYEGTWVIAGATRQSYSGYYRDMLNILYTQDLTGSWSMNFIEQVAGSIYGLKCYEGTWVVSANTNTFYSTNPAETWESRSVPNLNPRDIACHDGVWVLAGESRIDTYIYIATTTDPIGGSWKTVQVSTDTTGYSQKVAYCDGKWVVVGLNNAKQNEACLNFVHTAADPNGPWTSERLSTTSSYVNLSALASDGTTWAALGKTTGDVPIPAYLATSAGATLPTISVDGVYTYIKVKE